MRVTIDFGPEIERAIQNHLDGGAKVQTYVKAALTFFNTLHTTELAGNNCVGFGDKNRFKSYNTEVSPEHYLQVTQSEEEEK